MLFFKSLAVLSALAFGAISSLAAPAPVTETGLVARCSCDSLPTIIATLKDDISVSVAAIAAITADNCTVAAITPIVADIKAHVNVAITAVVALSGQPIDVIIGADIDVNAFAAIVADLLVFIFVSVGACLKVCVSVGVSASIMPLLCGLGEVVGALIVAILNVCAGIYVGLGVAIYGLIGVCVSVIIQLNISVLINVLAIVL
ncbi:uncharacterized protein PHACADRAFT_262062 [Phanerochaete carnosa HHB-10118-sp]|uniref:Hydrophobin n=1 Tax=Phanerochaete carnosa (strain HHB-10118-sp) TaxID=650164 RepID=K5UPM7_PHACS|nr:uncharacterized protein PHACADRAFT_262062 [Phanerochaete carnosa HHB-10118-sp]EKM51746.1 hypothetical protein PHACADRAFT_262062 [Phanerochaete carnosa HHB-10118-sp]